METSWKRRRAHVLAAAWSVSLGASTALGQSPYAEQWALEGPHDVDLIEGEGTALDLQPESDQPVVIGLIDTGVDYRHPALQSVLWTNPAEIPNNCLDDDGNGYVDDVHGIRTVVSEFDHTLLSGPELEEAFATACAQLEGEVCEPQPGAPCEPGSCRLRAGVSAAVAANHQRPIEGLNAAHVRATRALRGNPMLVPRACTGDDPALVEAVAEGDPMDFWFGHGTQMAGVMGARSGVQGTPASLLELTAPDGQPLGEHVRVVTCAAGYPANVHADGTRIYPRSTIEAAQECAEYFLALRRDQGVDLQVVNLSLGVSAAFPVATPLGPVDIPIVPDARLDDPAIEQLLRKLGEAGILVTAAVHNYFRDVDDTADHAMYPAAFDLPNVLGVGGINERGVWYGNHGRHTVDVVAPAQRIVRPAIGPDLAMLNRLVKPSAQVVQGTPPYDLKPDGEGTSEATAYVSTVAALLRAHAPTAHLEGDALRRLLMSSATELPPLPWMWILRQASSPALQAQHWATLGPFEPTTRAAKQRELNRKSRSGRLVRLDRAMACSDARFERLVSPVPRLVQPGEPLHVAAESFVCAEPAPAGALGAWVQHPDGSTDPLWLWATDRPGYFGTSLPATQPGTYRFWLANSPDDVLEVVRPSVL